MVRVIFLLFPPLPVVCLMDVIVDSFLGVKFYFKVCVIFLSLFPPLPVVCLMDVIVDKYMTTNYCTVVMGFCNMNYLFIC